MIRALKRATAPCYTDLKVEWIQVEAQPISVAPKEKLTYFANDLFLLTAIISKEGLTNESKVKITLTDTLKKESISS